MVVNNNPYLRDTEYIDPTFYIPEGLDEWQYDPTGHEVEHNESEGIEPDSSLVDAGSASAPADSLDVPEGFKVVSQTVRRQRDGHRVVDVVIEVDNVPGATKYEMRVTKA